MLLDNLYCDAEVSADGHEWSNAPYVKAAVGSNDYGLGMIVDRVSHSKYWQHLAVFVIEDDAQDGPDHVDTRRTVGLVVSPYCRRGIVDSTLHILRTMELLLGLQPMSQYDAAANPMYASLADKPDLTPYQHLKTIGIHARNKASAWGSQRSLDIDFSDFDRTPMFALNEIIWKNVKGPDSNAAAGQPLSCRRPSTLGHKFDFVFSVFGL